MSLVSVHKTKSQFDLAWLSFSGSIFVVGPEITLTKSMAGERNAALDSDDLLYLKEQMEAEEDAERLRRRTEKRAFAAFKRAASLVDSSPSSIPLPLRVEPKPKSGIRQQVLLKNILEIKPKRHCISGPSSDISNGGQTPDAINVNTSVNVEDHSSRKQATPLEQSKEETSGGLLGLAYESSDED
eukprot:Gb_35241 [translate_table: standard]